MNADRYSIEMTNLGKMYKLFPSQGARIREVLGINRLMFWRKSAYREFWALRGISLQVRRGERIGIIGHNGAGKSTLLKTLIGAHAATEGSLRVRGRIQALMQLGTGFHPDFTGRENIRASLAYNSLSVREMAEAEDEIVDFTELGDFIDQPVKNYSAGMYARLAFATATAIKPEILVIDEVLGAGDAYFSGKCVERMKRLSVESGATVLFVSHDLASVQNMCERCIWIDRGMLRMDGPSLDVIKAYSARVREREEQRLRVRNEKKLVTGQSVDVDATRQQAFRLRLEGAQDCELLVRRIAVYHDGRSVGEVIPGTPMDSDAGQPVFIYVNENSLAWSEPFHEAEDLHRKVSLTTDRLAIFGALVQSPWSLGSFGIEIDCKVLKGTGTVLVEAFDEAKGEYVGIGSWQASGAAVFRAGAFDLADDKDNVTERPPVDEYGSGECRIRGVRFETEGDSGYTVRKGGVLSIAIDYEADRDLPDPLFVFAAYLPSGQPAMQIGHSLSECGRSVLRKGRGTFRFKIDRLHLGAGAYIASAAIFKERPKAGAEPPAYQLIDRKIEFSVYSPGIEDIATGVCVQESVPQLEECRT